jgi:TolA-binding protein
VERHPQSPLRDPALLAKADIFLASRAWKSAAEEFERVAVAAHRDDIRAEAELRAAASVFLDGAIDDGIGKLRQVATSRAGSSQAGRAQSLLGEVLFSQGDFEGAIVEFHQVLATYFDATLAARAQYRIGRSLDALGRSEEATSAYQAVVAGYTQEAEAPAAAYLAGVGMLESGRPLTAAPYFQIVVDRYAEEREGTVVFAAPEHQELVEASLCLLQLSYHQAGDLGQLSGVPHLLLGKMPQSDSPWRAFALLIDADALASLSRYDEARATLETLLQNFPQAELAVPATRLLAWTYSQQGETELAIAAESRILDRYKESGDEEALAAATLHRAHILFNEKKYRESAASYDVFTQRFPSDERVGAALYQAGLSHQRAGNTGDAVDRWENLVLQDPASDVSRKAWARAADLYFQAEHYEDAKRCFLGLLENFAGTDVEPNARLRIAQCEYNRGADAEALEGFAEIVRTFPETPYAKAAERGMEQALYRLGQSNQGEEVLAQLVERFPTGAFAADALYEIAMRRYQAGDYGAAADGFRRVVTQFPSHSSADRAHNLMADSYERGGHPEEALRAYEQFLYFFPSSALRAAVRFRLGTLRFESGDYLRAAVDFTTVLEEEIATETAGASRYNLALCQIQLGNAEEAAKSADRFRQEHGDSDGRVADLAYRMGELHERGGRLESAAAAYEAALEEGADNVLAVELHYRLGTCREDSAPEAALDHYRRAVKLARVEHPYYLSAVARLAALHEDRGEYEDAVVAYRKLIRHSSDAELVAAARERVEQLAALGT